jgi:predicted DNA-binding helix-hairpin-helix protein
MVGIVRKPDTQDKLKILSTDAQYDLACACGSSKEESRKRGGQGRWIYPVTLPNGGTSVLFKTLLSNVCSYDCRYCPLRQQQDIQRCSLTPEETARVFLEYQRRREVFGLFLSSSVVGSPDQTMERLNTTARLLRGKHGFRGYIHLKVIPGASPAAIEEAVSLASAVSLNIETPGQDYLQRLSRKKDYLKDIVEPMKLVSRLTGPGSRYRRVKQTTQFIVGAAGESDERIVKYMWGLYDRLNLHRVYFSSYQPSEGDVVIAGTELNAQQAADRFTREHRLYQVDFLFRKYGFTEADIGFNELGGLSLDVDPKEAWALRHPERFPVNVNTGSQWELLRVPGLGPITVKQIIKRRHIARLRSLQDIGKVGARLRKAKNYLIF